jgi:hypothetical protein
MKKASRRSVRYTACTPHRWKGNRRDRVRWWKDAERTRTVRDREKARG